ncbi:MAG: trehalose-6-phosphate synthase [Candidatus Omnitrophota bacterium]
MWDRRSLQKTIKDKFGDYQFVVVSNREPYLHEYRGNTIKWIKAVSGLTIALDPVMQATGGIWIAYGDGNADRETVDEDDKVRVPPDGPSYILRRVWMDKAEEKGYYYGYSNQALWPLSHISYEKPIFDAEHWQYYKNINKRFAGAVIKESSGKKSFIWLQDYHLALCAEYIKEQSPDNIVSLFWHIPWPNPETFRVCPQKLEILKGLLANDLLGFHLRYHCHNFLSTIEQEMEAKVDWEEMSVTYRGSKTLVRPFPISVDFQEISDLARSGKVTAAGENIHELISSNYKILALGIDRIDYTKGLVEKLRAVDRFLEKYPEYQGKFVFAQFGALSRIRIKSYKQLLDNLQAVAEDINWKYRSGRWQPIVLVNKRIDYFTHLALYRMADLCFVSSLHDGMNLVAKEFISANVDCKGMLLLSKFTGSARELKNAVLINPYDPDGFADAIKQAIEMPPELRRKKIEKMRQIIAENNIYKWAVKFISNLVKL